MSIIYKSLPQGIRSGIVADYGPLKFRRGYSDVAKSSAGATVGMLETARSTSSTINYVSFSELSPRATNRLGIKEESGALRANPSSLRP
jgi:hypothetical protein